MSTWDDEIRILEDFFSNIEIPTRQINLNEKEVVTSPHRFVNIHFSIILENKDNERYRPYLTRLRQFMEILIEQHGIARPEHSNSGPMDEEGL